MSHPGLPVADPDAEVDGHNRRVERADVQGDDDRFRWRRVPCLIDPTAGWRRQFESDTLIGGDGVARADLDGTARRGDCSEAGDTHPALVPGSTTPLRLMFATLVVAAPSGLPSVSPLGARLSRCPLAVSGASRIRPIPDQIENARMRKRDATRRFNVLAGRGGSILMSSLSRGLPTLSLLVGAF